MITPGFTEILPFAGFDDEVLPTFTKGETVWAWRIDKGSACG
jgi:hypothetical protein